MSLSVAWSLLSLLTWLSSRYQQLTGDSRFWSFLNGPRKAGRFIKDSRGKQANYELLNTIRCIVCLPVYQYLFVACICACECLSLVSAYLSVIINVSFTIRSRCCLTEQHVYEHLKCTRPITTLLQGCLTALPWCLESHILLVIGIKKPLHT